MYFEYTCNKYYYYCMKLLQLMNMMNIQIKQHLEFEFETCLNLLFHGIKGLIFGTVLFPQV